MSRMIKLMMVAALSMTLAVPYTKAQGDAGSAQVTQAELAQMLVNLTGLARFLPNPATPQELFSALMASGISPADGWQADTVVTKAVLARVVVQSMGLADQVENPDDPNSWVKLLVENGIPIDTVGEAVQGISPSAEPVSDYVMGPGSSTDPLKKQQVFGLPDEKQFGTDIVGGGGVPAVAPARAPAPVEVPVTRREVRRVVPVVPKPPVKPATPDGGEGG